MRDMDRTSSLGPRLLFADRYLLGTVLGSGGMADVFLATDQLLGRSVAVKVFRVGARELTDTRRFEAETHTLASLSHPGLVTLFDAGTAADSAGLDIPYLVMELVDGQTLGAYRSGGVLAPDVVAQIGSALADALAYIHGAGVVHRDIKPANILVADHGAGLSTKLTDFGIARVVDADRLTEHGNTIGTAHYLSPEQATGNSTGPAADIYSLGLVLIECLSGRMAFEGSAIAAAVARLHRDPSVPPELGTEWVSLLTEMTSRRAEDRPTADAVAHRLRPLVDIGHVTPTAVLAAETDPIPLVVTRGGPQSRRRPIALWALPVAVVTAAALAALVVWGLSSTEQNSVTEPPTSLTSATLAPTPSPEIMTTDPPAPATVEPVPVEPAPVEPAPAETAPAETSASVPVPAVPSVPVATAPGNSGNGNNGNGNSGNGNNGNGNGNGNGRGNGNS